MPKSEQPELVFGQQGVIAVSDLDQRPPYVRPKGYLLGWP
jgi:hypothetical protein